MRILTKKEVVALHRVLAMLASRQGEDVLGILTYYCADILTSQEVVRLARKLRE